MAVLESVVVIAPLSDACGVAGYNDDETSTYFQVLLGSARDVLSHITRDNIEDRDANDDVKLMSRFRKFFERCRDNPFAFA